MFLDKALSRTCVANLLRSNWNTILGLDRNNEDIKKGSCELFRKILCVLKKDEAISSGFLYEIIKRISTFSPQPCVLECVSTIVEIHNSSNDNMLRNLISITSKACLSKCQEDPALCASYFEMLHRYYVFKPVVLYEFKSLPEIVIISARFVST